jgi:hypothetical protein
MTRADEIEAWEPSDPRASTTPPPEFMITGVRLPDGRYRVYASREFPAGLTFGQARLPGSVNPPDHWHVRTVLGKTLVIDGDSYRVIMEMIFTIWANEDRERARVAALDTLAGTVIGPSEGQRQLPGSDGSEGGDKGDDH